MGIRVHFYRKSDTEVASYKSNPDNWQNAYWSSQQTIGDLGFTAEKAIPGIFFILYQMCLDEVEVGLKEKWGFQELTNDATHGLRLYLHSSAVKALSDELDRIDIREFANSYDPKQLNAHNIYPDVWKEGHGNEGRDFLVNILKGLKAFVSKAAEHGDNIIATRG